MSFTVVSWNVEFFGSRRGGESAASVSQRVDRVFEYLKTPEMDADVYAIYEVKGSQVFGPVQAEFPDYTWTISEGSGAQMILIGSRIQAFTTWRTEFSRGFKGPLRPGALTTVTDGGIAFPILFLHLKAADRPIDFGVRAHQHDKARSLRKALDSAVDGQAPLVVAGDYNNVGLDLTFSDIAPHVDIDISLDGELGRLRKMYSSRFDNMPIRPKTQDVTFWNGIGSSDPPSDIDQVAAASNVEFAPLGGGAEIAVKGWPEQPDDATKTQWIGDFSDHAALRFTITGIN